MAGDWIKICKETPFKPEVLVIATKLNIHPDIAFSRCFHLWSWFDSNTKDGVTSGVTKITLDALLNRDGLCDALVSVGWLGENEEGNLYLPNFDRHNSETAKTRALGSKRQSKHRDKSNANGNATVTHETLPEKRREENINTKPIVPSKAVDACPHEKIIELYHSTLPTMPSVKVWTPKRSKLLQARWREDTKRQDLNYWERFFGYVSQSDFLCGRTEKPFNCDLEWMLNASNFVKIIEGKYHAG